MISDMIDTQETYYAVSDSQGLCSQAQAAKCFIYLVARAISRSQIERQLATLVSQSLSLVLQ